LVRRFVCEEHKRALPGGVRVRDGKHSCKSLPEAEGMEHGAKNWIGIRSEQRTHVIHRVTHLRHHEIFLNG